MNEYLQSLSRALNLLDPAEREDILADYREHFEIGLSEGKTENQIASELGDPTGIARLYTAINATTQAEKTKRPKDAMRMVGATFAYRMGKGMTVGTLYLMFVLAVIPVFALGAGLLLGAAALACLAVYEFVKGFIAFGIMAVFLGITLTSMGALCLMGAEVSWGKVIGALSALARRWLGRGEGKESVS